MPKLTAQQKMIAAGVAVGIFAILFVVLFIVPQFTRLAQLDSEMKAADAAILQANQTLQSRQAAKQQAAQTQAKLTRLENQIPDAPEMAALIIDLQDTANDAGVEWLTLKPSKPGDPANGYQKMPLEFDVSGRWDDVIDYLRRLNELERAIRVLSLEVVQQPSLNPTETTGVHEVKATVKLEVYTLPRTTGTAAPGAPGAAPAAAQ